MTEGAEQGEPQTVMNAKKKIGPTATFATEARGGEATEGTEEPRRHWAKRAKPQKKSRRVEQKRAGGGGRGGKKNQCAV